MKLPIQVQPIIRKVNTTKIGGKMPGVTASNTTKWACLHYGNVVGNVEIWWGGTPADGAWACNQWRSDCQGQCSAFQL